MNHKKPYFIVIDLYDLRNSIICASVMEVADVVSVHRTTVDVAGGLYGHYLVVPYRLR